MEVPCVSWLNWNPSVESRLNRKDENELTLWLLHERSKEKSKHSKYLERFPTDNSNFTHTYGEDAIKLLKGSLMQNSILQQQASIQQDYDTMKTSCPEFKDVSQKEYTEALAVIGSLSQIFRKNGHPKCAIMPLIDKFNFGDDEQVACHYNDEE